MPFSSEARAASSGASPDAVGVAGTGALVGGAAADAGASGCAATEVVATGAGSELAVVGGVFSTAVAVAVSVGATGAGTDVVCVGAGAAPCEVMLRITRNDATPAATPRTEIHNQRGERVSGIWMSGSGSMLLAEGGT